MADLTAIGPELHQRWQNPLPEGEVVRIGRAPRTGWKISWDPMISREHADLIWKDDTLQVRCLEMARNPVVVEGKKGDKFLLHVGESFRIGQTRFLISDSEDSSSNIAQEVVLDRKMTPFESSADAGRRLEIMMRLPELIGKSRTDEELAEQLTLLLLEALPRVRTAATIRFETTMDLELGKQPMVRWDSRQNEPTPFRPSMRLLRAAVHKGRGVLHYFRSDDGSPKYTVDDSMDWAICTPISTKGPDCWCLYVAGKSDFVTTPEALGPDLRFTALIAQFIGSVRQVRQLEKMQAGMSQYFSPTVMETLSGEFGEQLMAPKISDITVIFCDVRGFSKMTEASGVDLFPLLNRVSAALGMMNRAIVKYDGVIAGFQGDAALAFWGWPMASEEGVILACQAALAIQDSFCKARADAGHPLAGFRVGIGLAHGRAIAGKIGSDEHAEVSVFGPVVNLGSRLEGMTKLFNVSILMDEMTSEQIKKTLRPEEGLCRRLGGAFYPYGMQNAVTVSELLPPPGPWSSVTSQHVADFESAVDCVAGGNWSRARELFEKVPEDDGPRRFYLEFLSELDNKPPEGWDGVVPLKTK